MNEMRRIHVVSDYCQSNGIFAAAKLMASAEGSQVVDCWRFLFHIDINDFDEVVVHGCWLPRYWLACLRVLFARSRPRLKRMTHANLDPLRLQYHRWKKLPFFIVERLLFRLSDGVLVTGSWEQEWCEKWGLENEFEIVDLKKFFALGVDGSRSRTKDGSLHVLYLGRRHPLKGVEFLERADEEIRKKEKGEGRKCGVELRIVSDHFGEELERDWTWCDVLVLPTLSENFGLVVAEALERGKKVITTDGAPAWENQSGVTYLKGYRGGTDAQRVELLKNAIARILEGRNA